jgi:hypothetical protein
VAQVISAAQYFGGKPERDDRLVPLDDARAALGAKDFSTVGGNMIGLMGVNDKGEMFTPSGRRLFRLPLRLAAMVQRVQHWIAVKTWR